jgi:hypothetical protein
MYDQITLKEICNNSCAKLSQVKKGTNFFEEPFKHLYIDNFFDSEFIDNCLRYFPLDTDDCWEISNDKDIEIKYRTTWKSEFDIPDGIVDLIRVLNSGPFLYSMSQIMGIPKLIPDPYFTGGGLNMMKRAGLLDTHVDGNYHDATGLNRRVNAILYFNKGWEESWGGEFGIYDSNGENCLKKIAPIFNRLVIFDTHDKSFHGLPDPLNFPEDFPRRSLLLYYYTKESRPSSQIAQSEPHSALWKKRNFRDKKGKIKREYL